MTLSFSKFAKFFILIPLLLACLLIVDKDLYAPKPMPTPKKVDLAQVKCLATNIFYEAGAESYIGQAAVARVVMNRLRYGFANTPCKVIYQANFVDRGDRQIKLCQFSWVCEGKAKINERDPRLKQAMHIAFNVLAFDAYKEVIPKNVLFFHASFVNPNWPYTKVTQIGNHVFYSKGKR